MATTPDSQTDDEQLPLPPWSVHVMVYGGALFAAFNLVVSTGAVFELAMDGFKVGMLRSVGLAGVLDTGALVFGTAWAVGRRTRRKHLVQVGMPITLGLVAMSVVINMGEIAFQQEMIDPQTLLYLALAIGAAAPVAVLIMGHLVLIVLAMRESEQAGRPVKAKKPAEKKAAAKEPAVDVVPSSPQPMVDLTKRPAVADEPVPDAVPLRPKLTLAGNDEKVLAAVAQLAERPEGPAGPTDIARLSQVPLATTKRRLNLLVEAGRVTKNDGGVYSPVVLAEERAV